LAFSPQTRIDATISGLSKRHADRLETELRLVRERGYALNLEESVRGVRGIAAPIFGRDNEAVASIGASFPAMDLPQSRIPQVARAVRSGCAAIRKRCGYS
jgi:IclR family acetate operon transcriptional repressor